MISTSLNAAGYAAQAELSSSLSSASQDQSQELEQGQNFGTDFRQMMSSYASSGDSSEAQTNKQHPPSQDARSDQQSDVNESTVDMDPYTAGTSISKVPGLPPADEQSQPQSKSFIQGSTSLSAIQLLLKGAALAQVLSPVTVIEGSADGISTSAANRNLSVVSGSNQQMLATPAPNTGRLLARFSLALKGKTDVTKVGENRAAQQEATNSGVNLSLADLASSISPPPGLTASGQPTLANASGTSDLNVASAIGQTPGAQQSQVVTWNASSVAPEAKNFAFAVRLTGAGAQTANAPPEVSQESGGGGLIGEVQSAIAGVAASGHSSDKPAGEEAGSHPGEHGEPSAIGADLIMTSEGTSGAQITTGTSSASVADSAPASSTPSDAETGVSTEPVRNVHLQLTGDNNQRVDIRVVEIAGEMRVSVRAGDTRLAETLQDHIPDLAKGLNQQSLRADIWTPRSESTSPTNSSSNLAGQSSSRGSDDPNQGGQRQGNNRQQQNQPDWVDELENSSGPTTTIRSNQTWPQ